MKNIWKWVIGVAVLAGVIAGASVLYNRLTQEYNNETLMDNTQTQHDTVDESVQAAPDFTVLDYDGNEVHLSDYKGKPVVLNFWATWCYYCKVEMPDFQTAYEKYPSVQFLMINATDGAQETMASAKAYVEKENFTFDVFFDTELDAVSRYQVSGFPTTYFINKEGNLVAYRSGMMDLDTLEKGIKMITEQ